jgi:hypothetical protein
MNTFKSVDDFPFFDGDDEYRTRRMVHSQLQSPSQYLSKQNISSLPPHFTYSMRKSGASLHPYSSLNYEQRRSDFLYGINDLLGGGSEQYPPTFEKFQTHARKVLSRVTSLPRRSFLIDPPRRRLLAITTLMDQLY